MESGFLEFLHFSGSVKTNWQRRRSCRRPASLQVTKTVEFSGTQWGSLPYQYIFKERTGGKDRRRYQSSSTFNSGSFS